MSAVDPDLIQSAFTRLEDAKKAEHEAWAEAEVARDASRTAQRQYEEAVAEVHAAKAALDDLAAPA